MTMPPEPSQQDLEAALGRFLLAYEDLISGLRTLVAEMVSLGVPDIHSAIFDVGRRAHATTGHLPTGALISLLRSWWTADRLGEVIEPELFRRLDRAEELRNEIVHAHWSGDGYFENGRAHRSRFHRRQSKWVSDSIHLDEIASATKEMLFLNEEVWRLNALVERAAFSAIDEWEALGGVQIDRPDRWNGSA